VGLALVGVGAALGAVVFPDGREVLFALAAVGLFGGVLTYYLTPGTFVAADVVGERIYAAMAANEALSPVSSASATTASTSRPVSPVDARLYVPSDQPTSCPHPTSSTGRS